MTVGELLENITAREFIEWQEYYTIEPFGEYREDLRAGIISSTIVNMLKDKKGKTAKPEDFLPKFEKKKEQTWQEQLKMVEVMNTAYGGTDSRKNNQRNK